MKLTLLKKYPYYRRLWLADIASLTGSQISNVALLLTVYKLHSSTSEVAGLVILQTIPAIVFGLYAGAIIDRFPKKRLLIASDILRACTVVAIPFVHELWAMYALAFLTQIGTTLFSPTRESTIPELVEKENLLTANALSSVTFGTMLFLGPAIGGAIVAFWSTTAAFIIDSITFLISAVLISGIVIPHRIVSDHVTPTFKSLTRDIVIGFRYVRSHNLIGFIFLLFFTGNIALGFWFPVLPSFNKNFLDGNEFTFGLLTSAFGLGSLAGGMFAENLGRHFRKGMILYWTVILDASFFIAFSLIPWLIPSLVVLVIWGMLVVVLIVVYQTMMQEIVEPEFRGRVFSMSTIQFNGGMLIAQLIVMGSATVLRPEQIFLYAGVLYLIIIALASFHSGYKQLIRAS